MDAAEHFSWLSGFLAHDAAASHALTGELLDWRPTGPTLLDDLGKGYYDEAPCGGLVASRTGAPAPP